MVIEEKLVHTRAQVVIALFELSDLHHACLDSHLVVSVLLACFIDYSLKLADLLLEGSHFKFVGLQELVIIDDLVDSGFVLDLLCSLSEPKSRV